LLVCVSLRVAGITDLGVAKQVATLGLAENERSYACVEALSKQLAVLSRAKAPELFDLDLLRIREQMMALQRHTFGAASEKRPREREAGDSRASPNRRQRHPSSPRVHCGWVERAFPDLRCIADSTQPHFGHP
jgi:hypothetical protein